MASHNLLDTLGRVIIRRRWKYDNIFQDTVANVKANNNVFANATSHMWSPQLYVGEYSECMITFGMTGVSTGGAITTLQFQWQILDAGSGTYCNLGSVVTIGASFTIAAATANQPVIAYIQPTNFGGVVRCGVSMANTSTSDGNLLVTMHLKS